jgi:hypothetical protein
MVPVPPNQEAAAIIEDLVASEDESAVGEDDLVLRGNVSRLTLEKNTAQVVATIIAGNLPFTVGLTPQQTQERTIFPGKEIFIHYSLKCVKWI